MTICAAHWQEVTDPSLTGSECPLCLATAALREISESTVPDGNHKNRLAFCVALAIKAVALLEGEDVGKRKHGAPQDDPS